MTRSGATASAGSATSKRGSLPLLVASALAAPAVLLLGLATGAWSSLLVLAGVGALIVWSLLEIRSAFLVAVLLATFVDYTTGRIALEMGIVCAWLAWTSLLLFWRGAWRGWTRPPAGMMPGILVWLGACTLGVAIGLLRGNRLQDMGIELAAALWPLFGLALIQAYDRKSLVYAGVGMIGLGLIHSGFGLTMLSIYRQRLGGIYFTTVTGIVIVGLWTVALLAPRRSVRVLCLLAMVPMFAHLVFSFTRGYWLGCLVGLVIATALAWENLGRFSRGVRSRRLLMIPALTAVVAVTLGISVIVFGGGDLLSSLGERFGSSFSIEANGQSLSNVTRLAEYDQAIGAALRAPVIGNGLGYTIVTRDPIFGTIKEQWFVHNYYLLIWLKLGVVGLLAFGFLIWKFVGAAKRAAEEDTDWLVRAWAISAIAVTGQVLAILLTNYSLADVNTAFVTAFVWGIFWAARAGYRVASRTTR